ncbi:glycosyl hydrolase family 17 protein [Robertkochia sediminum]|uniref:glycosyl hydrolase family 17 protein n=1 Tax=Robertkochia sediminum TaxID=2785326 RepID=UPI0019323AD8|nr:glycosyl hydrolase family 17 protein [Robertkochia sediminum]MBL7471245.1 glycosyl hydrolase family 17 [Robertkochia sediminum]
MKRILSNTLYALLGILLLASCKQQEPKADVETVTDRTAADILGNPDFRAISYGGYRQTSRDIQPTLEELKEDLLIMEAMDIHLLRTYNVHFAQAGNILKAIKELKQEDPSFEMYVMLGAWIDCKNAWTSEPDHTGEDADRNTKEVNTAVELAKTYPDIVKIIAIGNEAMVHWAWSYWVEPGVILKYVNYVQDLKKKGELPADLWVTSSDNFASWGGGDASYHKEDLEALAKAVDFVSAHTYPFHDTHYTPEYWHNAIADGDSLTAAEQAEISMTSAIDYARMQYESVKDYLDSIGVQKPVHIGETGWASYTTELYGDEGSRATDEYKQALYHEYIRAWTDAEGISCFYFEAFDEPWKDAQNPGGSENHFGLLTVDGKAKYALWDLVDQGAFEGLTRNGNTIEKTFEGHVDSLMITVLKPLVLNK